MAADTHHLPPLSGKGGQSPRGAAGGESEGEVDAGRRPGSSSILGRLFGEPLVLLDLCMLKLVLKSVLKIILKLVIEQGVKLVLADQSIGHLL